MRIGAKGKFGLFAATVVVALSIFILNGRPLIYYDTAGYLEQGARLVGLFAPSPEAPVTSTSEPGPPAEPQKQVDKDVVGSRAAVYGFILEVVTILVGLPGMIAFNLGAIWLAVWIFARRLVAESGPALDVGVVTAIGLLSASLGSLPFYVAFLMPDIFAPILILLVAVLAVYSDRLTRQELIVVVLLSLLAIVVHPSHLLLAILLAPIATFASPLVSGRRLKLALLLTVVLVGAGLTEKFVFGMAVERFMHKRVVYLPFLTARLIDDGPGRTYLASRCPDPSYPTCALFEALSASDDPTRFDAPNIVFARTPQRGSYQHLSDEQRFAVAEDQIRFLGDVLTADPVGVAAAVVDNIATQLAYFSVEMTIPAPDTLVAASKITNQLPVSLGNGHLVSPQPPWTGALYVAQGLVYGASLVVLAFLALRRQISRASVTVLFIVLGGIVANAVVCGAVSEPAHRYGARVMFLLPLLAAMFWIARRPPQSRH